MPGVFGLGSARLPGGGGRALLPAAGGQQQRPGSQQRSPNDGHRTQLGAGVRQPVEAGAANAHWPGSAKIPVPTGCFLMVNVAVSADAGATDAASGSTEASSVNAATATRRRDRGPSPEATEGRVM